MVVRSVDAFENASCCLNPSFHARMLKLSLCVIHIWQVIFVSGGVNSYWGKKTHFVCKQEGNQTKRSKSDEYLSWS